jgi:carboxymethylenebutenolidase
MRGLPLLLALALAACAGQQPGAASHPDAESRAAYTEAMAREHAHDEPVANAATAPAPRQEVTAQEVVYGTVGGQPARGYYAAPAGRGANRLPAVVMIHEWWGLNDQIKGMARRLAGEGYRVLAVDMYGRVATTPQEARQYMGEIMQNTSRGVEHLRAAGTYLKRQGPNAKVGVTGWCFGGAWTLQAALVMPEQVDAAVMYYGRVVTDREQLSRLDAPLLGLFGAEDRGIPVDSVRAMESTLEALGKSVEIVVYEGAHHGFANPTGQGYNAQAAEDAWRRTTEFFARNLK